MSTFRYLLVLSTSAVAFGLGVDQLYSYLNISPQAIIGEAAEIVPESMKMLAVLVLVTISIKPLYAQFRKLIRRKGKAQVYMSGFPDVQGVGLNTPCTSPISGCGCDHHHQPHQKK
jgi:hypothetical protein